jgi:hypothetical protein
MDDGRLKCLRHPGENYDCEAEGLTLEQASERSRLFHETFYVCRNCGRNGATIEKRVYRRRETLTVRGAMIWGWGSALIVVPLLAWMRWWQAAFVIGLTLLSMPGIYWWENRKLDKALSLRGLPRPDAPGRYPIPEPTTGSNDDRAAIVGRKLTTDPLNPQATGPCCDAPEWIPAWRVTNDDKVPCHACGEGVMTVSDHGIH